jgi:hypothetical protein
MSGASASATSAPREAELIRVRGAPLLRARDRSAPVALVGAARADDAPASVAVEAQQLHRKEPNNMRCRRPPILTTVVTAAAFSLAVAGCGSSSPTSPSASNSANQLTQAQLQQDAFRFADCMRSHGALNFPDPTSSPHDIKPSLSPNSAETRSPAFQSAATACQHLLPGGALPNQSEAHSPAQIAAFVAFAHCMRSHGFPSFPDPPSRGQVTPQMLANVGINLQQPAVLQAGDACVSVTHGVITRATVAQFVAGQ